MANSLQVKPSEKAVAGSEGARAVSHITNESGSVSSLVSIPVGGGPMDADDLATASDTQRAAPGKRTSDGKKVAQGGLGFEWEEKMNRSMAGFSKTDIEAGCQSRPTPARGPVGDPGFTDEGAHADMKESTATPPRVKGKVSGY